jgi:RNA polymerase sigma factor (sigma-70 family)
MPEVKAILISDGELLKAYLLARDEASFRTLVERHSGLVHSTARRLLRGDSSAADDITQAVFLVLVQKAPSLTGMSDIGGWLYRTTCFVVKSWQREQAKHSSDVRTLGERGQSMPEQDAVKNEVLKSLDEALLELREPFRVVVLMHHIEGMAIEQVARKLGLAAGTVRSRLGRAVEKIRKTLLRRKTAVTSSVLLAILASSRAEAAPAALTSQLTALGAGAGAVSGTVISLAKGGLAMLLVAKIKAVAAAVVIAILSGAVVLGGTTIVLSGKSPVTATAEEAKDTASKPVQDETPAPKDEAKPAVVDTSKPAIDPQTGQPVDPKRIPSITPGLRMDPKTGLPVIIVMGPLSKKVTFEFVDTPLEDAAKFLSEVAGLKIDLDPKLGAKLKTPITLRVTDMKVILALDWVTRLAGCGWYGKDGTPFITTLEAAQAVTFSATTQAPDADQAAKDAELNAAIAKALEKEVTFNFVDTPVTDAVHFLQQLLNVSIVIDPAVVKDAAATGITLKVDKMPAGTALAWILKMAGLEYTIKEGAVFITKPAPPAEQKAPINNKDPKITP